MTDYQLKPQMGRVGFPYGEAAFYGLTSLKGHIWPFVLRVGLIYGLVTAVASFLPLMSMGEYMQWIESLSSGGEPDLAQGIQALGKMYGSSGILWIVLLVLYPSTMNAALRWYLYQDMSGQVGALRFGMDEVRTFLITLFWYLFVFILPMIVFGGLLMAMAVMKLAPALVGVSAFLMFIGYAVFTVFFGVRLSLCVPLSLDRRQFVFWDSMRLTKKRGWSLLGTFLILVAVMMVAAMVVGIVGQTMFLSNFMGSILASAQSGAGDEVILQSMMGAFKSPWMIIGGIVYIALNTVVSLGYQYANFGLTAYAMRFLQEEKGDIVSDLEVFD